MQVKALARRAAAVFLALHGPAHMLAFAVAWRLTESPDLPYATEIFGGRLDVGDVGARVVGLLWVAAALAFVVAAYRLWIAAPTAVALVTGAALFSTLLCLTDPGPAKVGLAINAIVLAAAAVARTPAARVLHRAR